MRLIAGEKRNQHFGDVVEGHREGPAGDCQDQPETARTEQQCGAEDGESEGDENLARVVRLDCRIGFAESDVNA